MIQYIGLKCIRDIKKNRRENTLFVLKNNYISTFKFLFNRLFENNEETLSDNYAGIIKTMLMTSFYASIIPLGILFSIVALTLLYWVYKY